MRQVVLDTETTGLSTSHGHRIIEIGCVELVNRRLTGRHFHRFLNPERAIDEGAEAVHGISLADLETQPKFAEVVEEFLEFIRGSELVIHNAEFDVGFLEYELKLMQHSRPVITEHVGVLDTLSLARSLHPGQRNSLDALCKRYEVDASSRELHGALIDAELLAHVYLAMTGGQTALTLDHSIEAENGDKVPDTLRKRRTDLHLVVRKPSEEELAKHEKMLDFVEKSGGCLWRE